MPHGSIIMQWEDCCDSYVHTFFGKGSWHHGIESCDRRVVWSPAATVR